MKKILVTLAVIEIFIAAANAQPANDELCNAIALAVAPNLEECTPVQAIQWTAATVTNTPNPSCGSGQLLDVWYKFVALPNGKINIRVSLPAGATNDGAMAVYSAAACTGSFTEVGCNDDYNGLNPGLNLTGLIAAQTYYIRFWSLGSAAGNYLLCLSNPAPAPPAIDPNKRVGINYDFPETNLDINGEVMIRGGNPQPGKVLMAANSKGKIEWKDLPVIPPPFDKRLFKAILRFSQPTGRNNETKLNFDSVTYDIGGGYDRLNKKYVIRDSVGSIYQFTISLDLTLSYTPAPYSNIPAFQDIYISVYHNNILENVFNNLLLTQESHLANHRKTVSYVFEIKTTTNIDEIYVTIINEGFQYGTIISSSQNLNPLTLAYGTGSFFSGQKIY